MYQRRYTIQEIKNEIGPLGELAQDGIDRALSDWVHDVDGGAILSSSQEVADELKTRGEGIPATPHIVGLMGISLLKGAARDGGDLHSLVDASREIARAVDILDYDVDRIFADCARDR